MTTLQNSRSPFRLTGRVASTIVLALSVGANGYAQNSDLEDDENFKAFYGADDTNSQLSLGIGFSTSDEGDLNKSAGDLSISRSFLHLKYDWARETQSAFGASLLEEQSNYDFDGANPIGFTNAFRTVKRSRFGLSYSSQDEDGRWLFDGALTFGREKGVSPSEGLYGEALITKFWQSDEDVEFGIGLYTYSKLEDSAAFVPFPIINWRISENLRLGLIESSAPSYGLECKLSERWMAYLAGDYIVRQYRLESRAALSDGVAVDEDLRGRLGLRYAGNALNFEIYGGLSRHKISIDAGGSLAARDVADPATVIGASLSCSL